MVSRIAAVVLGAWLLAGCAAPAPAWRPQATQPVRAPILFATDREFEPDRAPSRRLAPYRASSAPLTVGTATVEIGPGHRISHVNDLTLVDVEAQRVAEVPSDWAEFGPANWNYLGAISRQAEGFVNEVVAPAARKGSHQSVLMFIHGYNTSFPWAARRTAQLGADLGFITTNGHMAGSVILYSWPSAGTPLGYIEDLENIEWTQPKLVSVLGHLSELRRQGIQVNLVAHSLGCRALSWALHDIARERGNGGIFFDEVVFIAPDMDNALFKYYSTAFVPAVRRLTLYTSSGDNALLASRWLRGGYARLGLFFPSVFLNLVSDIGRGVEAATGFIRPDAPPIQFRGTGAVQVIDASALDAGHGYQSPRFIDDLRNLLLHGTAPGSGRRSNLVGLVFERGPDETVAVRKAQPGEAPEFWAFPR